MELGALALLAVRVALTGAVVVLVWGSVGLWSATRVPAERGACPCCHARVTVRGARWRCGVCRASARSAPPAQSEEVAS